MRLLLDASISYRLVAKLSGYFTECRHVENIGLSTAPKDLEIWNYALKNNFIIVTNDEDFLNIVNLKGFPPKVVLLRTGNQSNDFLLKVIITHIRDIEALNTSKEVGLLEIF